MQFGAIGAFLASLPLFLREHSAERVSSFTCFAPSSGRTRPGCIDSDTRFLHDTRPGCARNTAFTPPVLGDGSSVISHVGDINPRDTYCIDTVHRVHHVRRIVAVVGDSEIVTTIFHFVFFKIFGATDMVPQFQHVPAVHTMR